MARRTVLAVVVVGIAFPLLIVIRVLVAHGWDPTAMTAFGEEDQSTRVYAEERLGQIVLRPGLGHDGRFFFVQANDPLVLDPEQNAEVMDRPTYRSQRMLYPVLAGGAGLFPPEAIVWSMIVVNLVAMGVGTWAVAAIAVWHGGSPWWGLAFPLNVGLVSEMTIGGAGVVAAATAFLAVAVFLKTRTGLGIVLLVLAALGREAMLLVAAGSAVWLWTNENRREAVATVLLPTGAAALWAIYLRIRIESAASMAEIEEIGWPFVGLIQAIGSWLTEPIGMVTGLIVIAILVFFSVRALAAKKLIGYAFLGFAGLAAILTEQVWHSYFDITRAVAPLLTAFVLLVFVVDRATSVRNRTGVLPSS